MLSQKNVFPHQLVPLIEFQPGHQFMISFLSLNPSASTQLFRA
jgi:hypothetical protein